MTDEQLLTVEVAAQRLSVKTSTMRKWVFTRRIPIVKIGRCVRVRESDVSALIRDGLRPALRDGDGR